MIKTAIVGASGYTGLELLRLLAAHPESDVVSVTSRQLSGKKVTEVFPALAGATGGLDALIFEEPDPAKVTRESEMVFTAVPHRTAMEVIPSLLEGGAKVIDLSADFRFNDPEVYAAWYEPHIAPELTAESVYGLPELYRDAIKTARLVGNPGCYPTSIILAMAPLLKNNLVDPDTIIADSKSGVSGAGRGGKPGTSFCEVNDGFSAYKVTGHRHTPEIEQELGLLAGKDVRISFTPHLVPMARGILSTVYANLSRPVDAAEVWSAMNEFYKDEVFVRVREPGDQPSTLDVRGTNFCDLGVWVDERTNRVKVVSVIDNLTRGASGQAVCNMNLMAGLDSATGLGGLGLRP